MGIGLLRGANRRFDLRRSGRPLAQSRDQLPCGFVREQLDQRACLGFMYFAHASCRSDLIDMMTDQNSPQAMGKSVRAGEGLDSGCVACLLRDFAAVRVRRRDGSVWL